MISSDNPTLSFSPTRLIWAADLHFVPNPQYPNECVALNSLHLEPVYLGSPWNNLRVLREQGLQADQALSSLGESHGQHDVCRVRDALLAARVVTDKDDSSACTVEYNGIADRRVLRELYLTLTLGCNLACAFCLSGSNSKTSSRKMSVGTALKAVHAFSKVIDPIAQNRIVFYGGEPLLAWDVIQPVLRFVSQLPKFGRNIGEFRCKIITNGTLLTEAVARVLAEHDVEVVLSLDGPPPLNAELRPAKNNQTHSANGLQALRILQTFDADVSVATTITEYSLQHLDALMSWLVELRRPVMLSVVKQTKGSLHQIGFSEEVSSIMIKLYEALMSVGVIDARLGEMLDSFRKNRPLLQDCFAQGAHQIVITPDGRIGPCQGFVTDHQFFTEANDHPEQVDWLNLSPMETWRQRMAVNMDPCRTCEALGICGGGCPASASYNQDSIFAIDEVHCRQSKKVLPWLLWSVFPDPQLRQRLNLRNYHRFGQFENEAKQRVS